MFIENTLKSMSRIWSEKYEALLTRKIGKSRFSIFSFIQKSINVHIFYKLYL